ncbi:MAG: response regulator transcription factor [Nocardioides sp.]
MTTTVALVDDQDLVRTGFRMILSVEDDLELVGEASDGLAATRLVADVVPDVVLMDVQMPTMDGIEATRRIVADSETRVVILTTFERDDYLFAALEAGASGFLLKSCTAEELVGAIRNVAEGHALLAPQMTRSLIERFTRGLTTTPERNDAIPTPPPATTPALESLTERERDVLTLLARGLSNAEIADELVLGTATIKTHVSRILTKLDLRDRVQAVVLAYLTGLVGGAPPSQD